MRGKTYGDVQGPGKRRKIRNKSNKQKQNNSQAWEPFCLSSVEVQIIQKVRCKCQ